MFAKLANQIAQVSVLTEEFSCGFGVFQFPLYGVRFLSGQLAIEVG